MQLENKVSKQSQSNKLAARQLWQLRIVTRSTGKKRGQEAEEFNKLVYNEVHHHLSTCFIVFHYCVSVGELGCKNRLGAVKDGTQIWHQDKGLHYACGQQPKKHAIVVSVVVGCGWKSLPLWMLVPVCDRRKVSTHGLCLPQIQTAGADESGEGNLQVSCYVLALGRNVLETLELTLLTLGKFGKRNKFCRLSPSRSDGNTCNASARVSAFRSFFKIGLGDVRRELHSLCSRPTQAVPIHLPEQLQSASS